MANARFSWNNLWSAAATVISASSAASGLPAAASQNSDRSYVWRSLTQAGDEQLTVDLGSAQACTAVMIANVRQKSGGSCKLQQAGSGGSPGAWVDVVTLPAQDSDTRVTFAFFGSTSARHWRIFFTNGGGSDYNEAGYVFLGTYFEPAFNPAWPEISRLDPAVPSPSVDGQETFASRTYYASGELAWEDGLGESDLTTLRQIYRTNGIRTPLFLVLETDKAWTALLVRMASDIRVQLLAASPRSYAISFDWREAR